MSKIYSTYENNLDRAWYKSSNVFYSECDDVENSLKTVRITFNNGRTYKYSDVNVNDYLFFREAKSQGTVFKRYFSRYKSERMEDLDINKLTEELNKLIEENKEDDFSVVINEYYELITIKNNDKDVTTISFENKNLITVLDELLTNLKIKHNYE